MPTNTHLQLITNLTIFLLMYELVIKPHMQRLARPGAIQATFLKNKKHSFLVIDMKTHDGNQLHDW